LNKKKELAASLTMDNPPPADPPPPIAMPPVPHQRRPIQDAARNTNVQILEDDGTETTESAYLRWNSPNVKQAYQKWPREQKPSQILDDGKGKIVWAKVLLRDMGRTDGRVIYRRSKMNVAIKQLCRMYPRFRQGGEDPYAEISVMRNHGDHEHIFTCYEELQDEDHLYIVTLMARHGDLCYHIFEHGRFRPRDEVPRGVAKQLLRYTVTSSHRTFLSTRFHGFPLLIAP
jgi:Protein tyrosine and serine/threonine kinase